MTQDSATLSPPRPTRRAVTRTAIWTVPVIAVAATAPAYAASPCDSRTDQALKWSASTTSFAPKPETNGLVASFDPDGAGQVPALILTIGATFTNNMAPGLEPGLQDVRNGDGSQLNFRVASGVGNLGSTMSALTLQQATSSASPLGYAERGTYTFTFSQPVSNLRFTLTDIDSSTGDFWDGIQLVNPAPTRAVAENSAVLVTSSTDSRGAAVSPPFWRAANNSSGSNNTTGSNGNLVVSYAGPISSFQLVYFNNQTSYSATTDTDQVVYITDLTADYKPC